MTLLNEAAGTDEGLETYLRADTTLMGMLSGGVFSEYIGKRSDSTPLVRFVLLESSDLMTISGNRVWSELVYQVEAITKGYDLTETKAIADRLDVLLHLLRGQTWSTVLVEEVFRRTPLFRRTLEGDQPYAYAGGEYVFHVSDV